MSSVATSTASPHYFQASQASSDKTGQDAKTSAVPSVTPQQQSPVVAAKVVETASTRNADGTFGPKHTIHAPSNYTKGAKVVASAATASDEGSALDVKV